MHRSYTSCSSRKSLYIDVMGCACVHYPITVQ
uniref:Uncharacterized protein n=1 Tax=Anguilla anguilla TaxID=7936 RepID=A0A0E9Q151_ANGAN